MTEKSVCVIGAGLSGLTAVKCMLDAGFRVTCFEKENHVGGMWNCSSHKSVPYNTITNIPHIYSGFSDFPIPDHYPYYLTASDYCKYFQEYAVEFRLLQYVKLSCEVLHAVPKYSDKNKDFLAWHVTYKCDETETLETFDYVIVALGFYNQPYIPERVENVLNSFNGQVIHSLFYKDWKPFKDQTVVVCGLGSSGGDISCDLSKHTKQTFVSSSMGAHVIGRFFGGGLTPIELISKRFSILKYAPSFVENWLKKKIANATYNENDLRLTPTYSNSVTFNDDLCLRIASGKIMIKPSITKIDKHTVYFENNTSAENVDAILLCTGFARNFPFLDKSIIQLSQNGKYIPAYKHIFTTTLRDRLAFVGMGNVAGPTPLTSEMQARYVAEVLKGNIQLPSSQQMEEYIEDELKVIKGMYSENVKEYNHVLNCWDYFDDLANDVGCRPSLFRLCFTDPQLARHLINRHSVYQYRLCGPNQWQGARDAIIKESESRYAFMKGSREI